MATGNFALLKLKKEKKLKIKGGREGERERGREERKRWNQILSVYTT